MVKRSKILADHTLLKTALGQEFHEPKNISEALARTHWVAAMREELEALDRNETWTLVPRIPSRNVFGSRWIYKTKVRFDGSTNRLEARLVAKGYNQKEGIDFDKTFSPVTKPSTVRIILSLQLSYNGPCVSLT